MANNYTVSRTIECWKKHTCTGCAGEYRYRFVRKLTAQGTSESKALDALNKKIESAVGHEVDIRPCPSCGRVQPDMIGQQKAAAHSTVAVLGTLLIIAPIVLGATYVLGGNLPAIIVAAILGIMALLQILVALENHNSNPERNLDKAQSFIDDGSMQQVKAGDPAQLEPPTKLIRGGQVIGLPLAVFAIVVALLPLGYQTTSGFAFNADTKPDVISPGTEVKLYLPNEIDCAKSYWRSVSVPKIANMPKIPGLDLNQIDFDLPYGPPIVKIANAAELGIADAPLNASSNDATWSQSMRVKTKEKHTHPWIWLKTTIPNDAKLAGKTVELAVAMDVQYPNVSGDQFFVKTEHMEKTFTLQLAKPGESEMYTMLWWGGLTGGGLLALIAGLILRGSNKALKNSVPPPVVEIDDADDDLESEGEEQITD